MNTSTFSLRPGVRHLRRGLSGLFPAGARPVPGGLVAPRHQPARWRAGWWRVGMAVLALVCFALAPAAAQTYTITTQAGTGTAGFGGDGGPATGAQLNSPNGVAVDGSGNVYIADFYNQRIRKVSAATGIITTVAGNGTNGLNGDGGPATSAQLSYPSAVAVDGSGNLYIADTYNQRIRQVSAATGVITTLAGTGGYGFGGDGGPATSALLFDPHGVAIDGSGNVLIADQGNNRIRQVSAATGIITTLAGNGAVGSSGDGGAATGAQLNNPTGVVVDGSGNVFIADLLNQRIRQVSAATGVITTLAGTGTYGFSGDGGAATSAQLYDPQSVAVDGNGNVFIADQGNHRLRKVTVATGVITTVAGNGTQGFGGDGGTATSAQLYGPTGVAVASSGKVFIADPTTQRIRQLTPTPSLTSLSPTSGQVGTIVTLTGTFLTGATAVSFNGTAATTFAAVNATTVTATVPTGATTGNVTVITPGGTSNGVAFTVNTLTAWTGAVSTDWYTTANWTAGVPTSALDATIPAGVPNSPLISSSVAIVRNLTLAAGASLTQRGGTLNTNADLTNNGTFTATGGTLVLGNTALASVLGSSATRFWNLTVNSNGAQLSTTASTSVQRLLTLTGNLVTNGNPLTLESAASGDALVVNNGGVVTGPATVQRAIDPSLNPGLGYRHYASPVSNSTVADLATSGFTPVVNPAYNSSATPGTTTPFPTVYGYDQSRLTLTNNLSEFDKGFFSPAAFTDPLVVGQGYTVNLGADQLVDFVGTLNTGTKAISLASNRTTNPGGGWQLVGNPYPAPLDYSLVAPADRLNLEGSVYVYSSTGQYVGQYRSYVNGIGGNSVLPAGQGFFVRVAAGQTSGTLTFRNSQRLTSPISTTFQRTVADSRPLVQLTLSSALSKASDEAYVYFQAGATVGFDAQYDATKLPNPNGLNLSSLAGPDQLAINGLPLLGTTAYTVPLAVGVPLTGTYTLTTAQLLNLATTPVYLRDRQMGTLTELHAQSTYTFTASNAALLTDRFELVFSPQQALATAPAALTQQVALYPNPAKQVAFVELPASLGSQAVPATLVDALGRELRKVVLPAQGTAPHALDLTELPPGVYALRLRTSAGLVVKKLVVN